MDPRVVDLVSRLRLTSHVEGGYYRELYRSRDQVSPGDGRPARPSLTTILFLLAEGQKSRWHRVRSDEVWHHHEGAPLALWVADATFSHVERHVVGAVGEGLPPEHVVPAGLWQAAESQGAYTLVGCVVAPGFDFADFTLLDGRLPDLAEKARRHPDAQRFL